MDALALDPAAFVLRDAVLREVLRADKAPDLTLQACEAWISAPAPVDALLAGAT